MPIVPSGLAPAQDAENRKPPLGLKHYFKSYTRLPEVIKVRNSLVNALDGLHCHAWDISGDSHKIVSHSECLKYKRVSLKNDQPRE